MHDKFPDGFKVEVKVESVKASSGPLAKKAVGVAEVHVTKTYPL